MKEIAKKVFRSRIGRENSFTSWTESEDAESVMTLYVDEFGQTAHIEWEVEELGACENIGIFCHEKPYVISDYDGVFEVPEQAIQLLEENGFDVSYLKD